MLCVTSGNVPLLIISGRDKLDKTVVLCAIGLDEFDFET